MTQKKKLVHERIKESCEELGISISELCRRSNVSRQVVNKWRLQDPKSIQTLDKLNETIEIIKQEKQA